MLDTYSMDTQGDMSPSFHTYFSFRMHCTFQKEMPSVDAVQ